MKKLFVIVFIAINFYCNGQRIPNPTVIKSDHIRIDHIGQNDKPFPSIVITSVPLKLQIEEWEVLISDEVFKSIKNEIAANVLLKRSIPKKREYGTFRILLLEAGKSNEYFLSTRSDSIEFLKKLKGDNIGKETAKQLVNQIDYLYSRIDVDK